MSMAWSRSGELDAGTVAAIGMALAAYAMFTGMDSAVKQLGSRYDVVQIVYLNSVFALPAIAAVGMARGGWRRLRPRRWRLHLARWSVSYLATLLIFWSYPRLPLADVYAILFASPLLVTALSAPILGEPVGWRCWLAVATGFLGVLVILAPGQGEVGWPALAALLGAIGHAVNMLLIRQIGRADEPVEAIGVAGNGLTVLLTPALLAWVWIVPSAPDLLLTALAGSVAGSAFLLLAAAFRAAPAATVAPFQYSQMLHGIAIGWLCFAERPGPRMLAGAAIVVGCGLYLLRHGIAPERRS